MYYYVAVGLVHDLKILDKQLLFDLRVYAEKRVAGPKQGKFTFNLPENVQKFTFRRRQDPTAGDKLRQLRM